MQLSKSDYMLYLKHPAWVWMKKHAREMLPPIDDALQSIFDTGHEFEQYAEALFPGGLTLGFDDYDSYRTLPARTRQALGDGEKVIFQGRFERDGFTFICDIIEVLGDKALDLYEIKSSTSAKPEHIQDLAFQAVILEASGYTVRNVSVIHVNNAYVRRGDVDPKQLTAITDVTEEVKAARKATIEAMPKAMNVIDLPDCPDTSPLHARNDAFREWLEVYKHMKRPKTGSIYDLCQLDAKTLGLLQENNITKLADIPEDFELKPKQRLQVEALRMGRPIIKKDEIQTFLADLTYPLYFLDYETLASLVPYFDGLRPYQQLPFQYSLHILDSPDSELRHEEYLHTDNSHPAEPLARALRSHIGDEGSVITWNMGFEKSCNSILAEFAPKYADFLQTVNERIVDLMTPFSQNWYVDADFKGSASIKNVLPVLVPELSYKHLGIQDGGSAQRLWMQAVLDGKQDAKKEQILDDLRAYCRLDTLAMVKIHQKLLQTQ